MTHDHPEPEHDALVHDVVEAFDRVEVPPMPDIADTAARLVSPPNAPAPEASASDRSSSWSLFKRRFGPLVAAAVLLFAVGAFFLFPTSFDSSAAFAQAVQQLRTAQTMAFTMTTAVTGQDRVLEMKATIKNPGWMQIEFEQQGQPFIQVMDHQSQQMVVLMPKQKFAQRINIEGMPRGENPNDIIAEFSRLDPEQVTYLYDEVKDGVECHVYDAHAGPLKGTTWIATATKRPVRIEFDGLPGRDAAPAGVPSIVMRDFAWDVPVDDVKFTLEIPEGYHILDVDMSNAQAQDLAELLRIYAALTRAPFPADFGVETIAGIQGVVMDPGATPQENHARLRESLTPVYGDEALQGKRFQKTMMAMGQTVGRAGIFMATLAEEAEHWRWVGGGVSAGTGDRALCWWKPKDGEAYRVIYNDFSIKQVAEDDLPVVPQ